jgi:hypothetical protein
MVKPFAIMLCNRLNKTEGKESDLHSYQWIQLSKRSRRSADSLNKFDIHFLFGTHQLVQVGSRAGLPRKEKTSAYIPISVCLLNHLFPLLFSVASFWSLFTVQETEEWAWFKLKGHNVQLKKQERGINCVYNQLLTCCTRKWLAIQCARYCVHVTVHNSK